MRPLAERAMRVASLLLVAWMIVAALAQGRRAPGAERARQPGLRAALERWSARAPDSLHAMLDSVPDRGARDWLVALRAGGSHVSWSSRPLPAMAVEVLPLADARGTLRLLVAAPADSVVAISDEGGALDTVRAARGGASFTVRHLAGAALVRSGGQTAAAYVRDSLLVRRVLVLGAAGWETKFAVAALEESDWLVDARMRVAPPVEVVQGSPGPPDTSRYAAVVLIGDAPMPEARTLEEYVRSGGGLVLANVPGQRVPRSLLAGDAGARLRAPAVSFVSTSPRRALALFPLVRLRRGAMPLEVRDGHVAAAAVRVGAGRVVQVGYDETWRWRFGGGENAPAAHRDWWSLVVASASYRAALPLSPVTRGESAPLAALVASLGPSTPPPAAAATPGDRGLRWWMLAALFALLLAEWGSRRLRGEV